MPLARNVHQCRRRNRAVRVEEIRARCRAGSRIAACNQNAPVLQECCGCACARAREVSCLRPLSALYHERGALHHQDRAEDQRNRNEHTLSGTFHWLPRQAQFACTLQPNSLRRRGTFFPESGQIARIMGTFSLHRAENPGGWCEGDDEGSMQSTSQTAAHLLVKICP